MSHADIFINNHWEPGAGAPFQSLNPATGEPAWQGNAASTEQVDRAIAAARAPPSPAGKAKHSPRSEPLSLIAQCLSSEQLKAQSCPNRN